MRPSSPWVFKNYRLAHFLLVPTLYLIPNPPLGAWRSLVQALETSHPLGSPPCRKIFGPVLPHFTPPLSWYLARLALSRTLIRVFWVRQPASHQFTSCIVRSNTLQYLLPLSIPALLLHRLAMSCPFLLLQSWPTLCATLNTRAHAVARRCANYTPFAPYSFQKPIWLDSLGTH
ncbi:hypothetical protein DFH06DRAFT_325845 [Mycena polygramma]|nr:hypothetical protein DFH06DRAFT_325845 [Mycena polygramma]